MDQTSSVPTTTYPKPGRHSNLPFKVRTHPHLGPFVEAPRPGHAYGQEVLGEDYEKAPFATREEDCHFVVLACNNYEKLVAENDLLRERIKALESEAGKL